MGTYRQPERIMDPSTAIVGKAIQNFDTQLNSMFKELNADNTKQQKANRKTQDKINTDKLKGWKEWQSAIKSAKPKQGFSKQMRDLLTNWGNEYYNLYGSSSKEDLDRMSELLSYPDQIAQTQGVIFANMEPYKTAMGLEDGAPNSINESTSWDVGNKIMYDVIVNNGSNFVMNEIRGTGGNPSTLMWQLTDYDGEKHNINNQELINYSETGELLFKTNGNIVEILSPYVDTWKDSIDYDKGSTEKVKGSTETVTTKYYDDENLLETGMQSDMTNLLSNYNTMSSIWPQLTKWAAENKPELVYGPNKEPGGGDDVITIDADGYPALWFGQTNNAISDEQKKVAKSILVEFPFGKENRAAFGLKEDKDITITPTTQDKTSITEELKITYSDWIDEKISDFDTIPSPEQIIEVVEKYQKGGKKLYTVNDLVKIFDEKPYGTDQSLWSKYFSSKEEAEKWVKENADSLYEGTDPYMDILSPSQYNNKEGVIKLIETYD